MSVRVCVCVKFFWAKLLCQVQQREEEEPRGGRAERRVFRHLLLAAAKSNVPKRTLRSVRRTPCG